MRTASAPGDPGQQVLDRYAPARALRVLPIVAAAGGAGAGLGALALARLLTGASPPAPALAAGLVAALATTAAEHAVRSMGARARGSAVAGLRTGVAAAELRPLTRAVRASAEQGAVAVRVTDVVDRVGPYYESYLPRRTAAAPAMAGAIAVAACGNLVVAGLWLLTVPVLVVNLVVVGLGAAAVSRRQLAESASLADRLLDRLRGLDTITAFGAAGREARGLERADRRLRELTLRMLGIGLLSTAVLELCVTMAVAVVATVIGLHLLRFWTLPAVPRPLDLTTGLWLLVATPLFFAPLRAYAAAYHARADALAAARELAGRLDPPAEPPAVVGPVVGSAGDGAPAGHALALRGVRLDGAGRALLDDVDLTVRAGEVLGVTGASGAGKTTLLALAAGLLRPDRGSVERAGLPATDRDAPPVGWAGQHGWLPPGTVADALRAGAPHAGDGDLRSAVVGVGLATPADAPAFLARGLGDDGRGLSAGERRRLSLARLLLGPPRPLLLLDEPTAHLDAGAEAEMVAAVRAVLHAGAGAFGAPRAAVVATHSPAVLGECTRVVRLERGRLEEVP